MSFEKWQEAWREGSASGANGGEGAALRRMAHEVRGKARSFERAIAWRDARESLGSLLVGAVFGWVAWLNWSAGRPSWTCWIAAVLAFAVAAFLLVDRLRARRNVRPRGDAVAAELERAIAEGRHQYWLLTNVLWWYLLPLGVSVGMIALHVMLYSSQALLVRSFVALAMTGATLALYFGLWRLNRRVADGELRSWIVELEDRRRQLTG